MMRYLRLVAYLFGALTIVGGAGWYVALRPIEVEVARPETNVGLQVFGLGTVEARVVSRIAFEVAGTITELHVDAGDRVTAGQLLARVDSREQAARLAQAQSGVSQAVAAIAQADANLVKARVALRQRQQVNLRRQELMRRGTVSDEAAQDAQAALDIAGADLTHAASALEIANANVQQARAVLAFETARMAKHELRAPFDAVVVARQREPGATANPGEAVFVLVDPTTIWALAHVDEVSAGSLAVGQAAEVRLRSLPRERFAARVVRIDVESDRVTEERRVYVKCDRCRPTFFLGEQAEVLITVGRLDRAILVPRQAIALYRGLSGRVWTVENGRLAVRDVAFGAQTLDARVEILSGLPDDAEVVTSILNAPRVGRSVTVTPAATR